MTDRPTLLERVAQGEQDSVRLALDRFGPLVWSIVRRQVPAHVAEDVVQEIFVEIWKSAGRYDPERASEATFVTTIARRRLIDHRRRAGRRPESEELELELPAEPERVDPVELADEARVASEALARLRPEQRLVLQLGVVEGLAHSRIAEVTGMPLGTVKSHARRGLERLRTLLDAKRPEEASS